MQVSNFERVGIGVYPTPYERMHRLEAQLNGPRLFVKREDLTGVALGGNKVRQLDYILVQARRNNCDYVITTSGIQSNWARQTTALAIKMGMKALLVLRTAQFTRKPSQFDGNILLDHIMGAEVKIIKMKINEDPAELLESEAEKLRRKSHNPLVLGLQAAVSAPAAIAYVDAARELIQQADDVIPDAIILATSAGATQAGLTLGAKMMGIRSKVIGVNVGAFSSSVVRNTIINTAAEAARILDSNVRLTGEDVIIVDDYIGGGYGIPTKAANNALLTAARTEALILDPVYTSKAMAGLIDMIKIGKLKEGENICFVHTGGIPALFPYKRHFQPQKR